MATATTKKKTIKKAAPKVAQTLGIPADAPLFDMQGKKAGSVAMPESIFGLPWNGDLVHQVVTSMQANARLPWAHTKTRGEVRGGGKKPWRQKGTGRARHGSTRSPIWVGGGIAHGPRNEKVYAKKINQKMRQKALLVALSRKYKDGELIFVNKIEMVAPKTSSAKTMLAALAGAGFDALSKSKNSALVVLPRADLNTQKSFSNFGNINAIQVQNLNPVSVLSAKYLIVAEPETAFEVLGKKHVVKPS